MPTIFESECASLLGISRFPEALGVDKETRVLRQRALRVREASLRMSMSLVGSLGLQLVCFDNSTEGC